MPMGNWLPDKLLPKNRAGKTAATMVGAAGTSPFFGAYSTSWATCCSPAARKAPTTSATTPGSPAASTAPSPITR
jgi:hypothetical protein